MKNTIIKTPKLYIYTAIVVILIASVGFVGAKSGYAVYVGDKQIGITKNRTAVEQALADIMADKTKETGYNVTADKLEFKKVSLKNKQPMTDKEIKNVLSKEIDFKVEATAIMVDGKQQFILADKDTANQLINKLKEHYNSENGKTTIEEKLSFKETTVLVNKLQSLEEAFNVALKGDGFSQYTVKEGDTLWDIAIANNISVDELTEANPGIKENLQLDQKINIGGKPVLTVVTTYSEEVTEKIPYQVVVKRNANLNVGQEKVIESGANGSKKVNYEVVLKNGSEVDRNVKDEVVEKEAVAKVVEKGSRPVAVASRGGNGSLLKPASGYVSSQYGQRWGRQHKGIDIASSYGSSVVAANSGTVISTGWVSGYGKTIDIKHSNGLVTRYAHLSSIQVKNNSSVSRGQIIGKIGTSGNTTGPNLHFEVLNGGVPQNPMRYL